MPSETTFTSEHMRWDEQVFSFTLQAGRGRSGQPDCRRAPAAQCRRRCDRAARSRPQDLGMVRARLRAGADQVSRPAGRHPDQHIRGTGDAGIRRAADRSGGAEGGAGRHAAGAAVLRRGGDRQGAAQRSRRSCSRATRKIWHYDRETHVLTVSDEITGEDGLVEFDGASEDGKVLYDGLGLTLTSGPLARVDVSAEYTWTQQAQRHGRSDRLSDLDTGRASVNGDITSYTIRRRRLAEDRAPASATAGRLPMRSAMTSYDLTVQTKTSGIESTVKFPDRHGSAPSTTTTSRTKAI